MTTLTTNEVIRDVGLEAEVKMLRERIDRWVANADPDMRPMLRQQFDGNSKYFRPMAVFAFHHAVSPHPVPHGVLSAAQAVEMFHNVTLIVDDIVDESDTRRNKLTQHAQYRRLTAWMVAGYIDACAIDLLAGRMPDEWADRFGHDDETRTRRSLDLADRSDDAGARDNAAASVFASPSFDTRRDWASIEGMGPVRFDLHLLSELKKRLAIAECVQWESRKGGVMTPASKRDWHRLGLADWRFLAREDTGSMFEICACLGARSQRYRRMGRLLGMLYHGCDDVADATGLESLGGGGEEDLREGILTLPAALALMHVDGFRAVFTKEVRDDADLAYLRKALLGQIPRAHDELDAIQHQVELEMQQLGVANPSQMMRLIRHTRQLAPRESRHGG